MKKTRSDYENFDKKNFPPVIVSIQSGRKNLIVPHFHTNYEFLKVTKGALFFTLDGDEFELNEGDIILCPSFSIHSATAKTEATETLGIVTEKLFYSDKDANSRITVAISSSGLSGRKLIIPKSDPDNEKISLLLNDIKRENHEQTTMHDLYISMLVNQVSITLARHFNLFENISSINKESFMLYSLEYIKEHCTERITLDDLSRVSKMSRFHFSRKFKEYTGSSPMNYVIRTRVNYALDLIKNTNLSMLEISEKSGFCSVNYFNKTIKEVTGYSPYTFKKLG